MSSAVVSNLSTINFVQGGDVAVGRGQLGRAAFLTITGAPPSQNLWDYAPMRPTRYFVDVSAATGVGLEVRLPLIGTAVANAQPGHVVYIKNYGATNSLVVKDNAGATITTLAVGAFAEFVATVAGPNSWTTTLISGSGGTLQQAYDASAQPNIKIATSTFPATTAVSIINDDANTSQSIFTVSKNDGAGQPDTTFFNISTGNSNAIITGLGNNSRPNAGISIYANNSVALGPNTFANVSDGFAFGDGAIVSGASSIAIGRGSSANDQCIAIGGNNLANVGARACGDISAQTIQFAFVSAAQYDGQYWTFATTSSNTYYVWYDSTGVAPDPAPGGAIGIKVTAGDLATAVDADTFAAATHSRLITSAAQIITATVLTDTITLTQKYGGAVSSALSGTTGAPPLIIGGTTGTNVEHAIVIGSQSIGSGNNCVIVGRDSTANSNYSVAIGHNTLVKNSMNGAAICRSAICNNSESAVVIGSNSICGTDAFNGAGSIVIGRDAKTAQFRDCEYAVAIGYNAQSGSGTSICLGYNTSLGQSLSYNSTQAIAIGINSTLGGTSNSFGSILIGANAVMEGAYSILMGRGSTIINGSDECVVIGNSSTAGIGATVANAVAIGRNAQVSNLIAANNGIAIGNGSLCNSENGVVIGALANGANTSLGCIAVGRNSRVGTNTSSPYSIAIGSDAGVGTTNGAFSSIALGNQAVANSGQAISIGTNAVVNGVFSADNSIAIGSNASVALSATADSSIIIGRSSSVNANDAICIGSQIANSGTGSVIINDGTASVTASFASRGILAFDGGLQLINKNANPATFVGTNNNSPSYRFLQTQLTTASSASATYDIAISNDTCVGARGSIIASRNSISGGGSPGDSWYFEFMVKAKRVGANPAQTTTPTVTSHGDTVGAAAPTIDITPDGNNMRLTVSGPTNPLLVNITWNITFMLNELTRE